MKLILEQYLKERSDIILQKSESLTEENHNLVVSSLNEESLIKKFFNRSTWALNFSMSVGISAGLVAALTGKKLPNVEKFVNTILPKSFVSKFTDMTEEALSEILFKLNNQIDDMKSYLMSPEGLIKRFTDPELIDKVKGHIKEMENARMSITNMAHGGQYLVLVTAALTLSSTVLILAWTILEGVIKNYTNVKSPIPELQKIQSESAKKLNIKLR